MSTPITINLNPNAQPPAPPLDSDLAAIAALSTTTFGRSLLTLANEAAARSALQLAAIAASGNASDLAGVLTKLQQHAQTAYYDQANTFNGNQTVIGSLSIEGTLGTELVTNGNFATNLTGWTGTNWSWSSGTALHTAGATASLSQSSTAGVIGDTYKVEFTISAATVGSVRMYFGGVWGGLKSTNATHTEYITATSVDTFLIEPTSDFDGKIDSVSVKKITTSQSMIVEPSSDFRKKIKIFDRIDWAEGLPTAIGYLALTKSTTGLYNIPSSNTAIGYHAGKETTTGHVTALGFRALESNTTGVATAVGKWALLSNTDGHATAFGNAAGMANTVGNGVYVGDEAGALTTTGNVTVVGYYAGQGNVTGAITAVGHNAGRYVGANGAMTAIGELAGAYNTGQGLTAVGVNAGRLNTTGLATAVGHNALESNTTSNSVAVGYQAGYLNTTGIVTAVGYEAALKNTTGVVAAVGTNAARENTTGYVTAVGYQAAYSNTTGYATAIGYNSLFNATTGDMIAIGLSAGYGVTPANSPVTDTAGILIGNFANRSVASATALTNYIGIGEGVLIEKSNQVILGNSSITETVLRGSVIATTGFGVGALADTSLPFRVLVASNASVGMLINNTSAGSSAASAIIVESDAGQAALRQYSSAHSVWPGSTVISSPSGGNGLVLVTSGTSNPIDFYTDNTLRASILDTGVVFTGTTKCGNYTVATLPSAASNAGHEANVTDSSVTTFGSTVAGGGSSNVKVRSNGTNWTVTGI